MDGMRKSIQVPPFTEEQLAALEQLYRKTELPRVRTRAQIILLSAEQGPKVEEIANRTRKCCDSSHLAHATYGRRARRVVGCTTSRPQSGCDGGISKATIIERSAATKEFKADIFQ